MVPSLSLCRTQEDIHRQRAANTSLENVRLIATNAAAAWAKEATAAESREARQRRIDTGAQTIDPTIEDAEAHDDVSLSENPDRGLAANAA